MHNFQIGREYSRSAIHTGVGGDMQGMLPMAGGRVVCCCITMQKNRQAPEKLLIGDFPRKLPAARQWAAEGHYVPLFVKRAVNRWDYRGDYRVVSSTEDPSVADAEKVRGEDPHVKIVLTLKARPHGEQ